MTALSASAPLAPTRPSALTVYAVLTLRSIRHSLRDPGALVMAIALPTIVMMLFTQVFGGALAPGGDYVNYVVPGTILLCAGFGAASTAVDVTTDMTTGIIDRFRTMPFRAATVIAGHVTASLVRNLVATGVVIGVALLVGFRPTGSLLDWLATLGLIAGYVLAITVLFAAIGLAAPTPAAATGYGFVLLFVPYLSSAFVPVSTMPEWLQPIAEHQPLTPIIETLRGLLLGTEIGDHGWWALLWCAAILAVSLVLTSVLFRSRAGRR